MRTAHKDSSQDMMFESIRAVSRNSLGIESPSLRKESFPTRKNKSLISDEHQLKIEVEKNEENIQKSIGILDNIPEIKECSQEDFSEKTITEENEEEEEEKFISSSKNSQSSG